MPSPNCAPLAARIGESVRARGGNHGFGGNQRGDTDRPPHHHDGQDSGVRQQAALIRKTESSKLVQPTLVSLDFHDRPMSEVIKEVTRQDTLPTQNLGDTSHLAGGKDHASYPGARTFLEGR